MKVMANNEKRIHIAYLIWSAVMTWYWIALFSLPGGNEALGFPPAMISLLLVAAHAFVLLRSVSRPIPYLLLGQLVNTAVFSFIAAYSERSCSCYALTMADFLPNYITLLMSVILLIRLYRKKAL